MPPHIKNERASLLRSREQILNDLAQLNADLVERLRDVDAALLVLNRPQSTKYAHFRNYKDAIILCLETEGPWLAKRVIADKLFRGGFNMDPEIGPRLVVDHINRNIVLGTYISNDEGLVGIPVSRK